MKLKKVLTPLIVLVILCSFIVAFISQTQIPNFQGFDSVFTVNQLVIRSPIDFGASSFANFPALNQSTRMSIYNYIEANPGIHFRALCSGLGIPIGVAQYHLGILTKTGLISFFQDGRYKHTSAPKASKPKRCRQSLS